MHVLVTYVPAGHIESVKEELFEAGAGDFGGYDKCSWEVFGVGQFRPGGESNPYIGKKGEVEEVGEYRLEVMCRDETVEKVLSALKRAHPYEVPAFHFLKVLGEEDLS